MKQELVFRLAEKRDKPALLSFMDANWGEKHPLLHDEKFFHFYYESGHGLNFALAEAPDGDIKAAAGFISCNQAGSDIWISLWCSKKEKGAQGAGLQLMGRMAQLTGAKHISCNNIRPETIPFYEFLGYTAGRVGHYYRMNPALLPEACRLAVSPLPPPPVSGGIILTPCKTQAQLKCFTPPEGLRPHKDFWYLQRRYFAYPYENGYSVYLGCRAHAGQPSVLLVMQKVAVPAAGTCVLRVVDYIGEIKDFSLLGEAFDALLQENCAEYLDCYAYGMPDEILLQAGLCARKEHSDTVIPNYLTPLRRENTEYYCFTSNPQGFLLFKADGDQNRPFLI